MGRLYNKIEVTSPLGRIFYFWSVDWIIHCVKNVNLFFLFSAELRGRAEHFTWKCKYFWRILQQYEERFFMVDVKYPEEMIISFNSDELSYLHINWMNFMGFMSFLWITCLLLRRCCVTGSLITFIFKVMKWWGI